MRRIFLFLSLMFFSTSVAYANYAAEKYLRDAEKVGEGRLSVFLFDFYDAVLYAPKGKWRADSSYVLSLNYFREIKGSDIAERSVEEIRKQGFIDAEKLANWRIKMLKIFPDVKNGSEITAVFLEQKSVIFYADGKLIGEIKDTEFNKNFSAIWLGDKTSEPDLRRKLLGIL
jgi:hypothetical protein